MAPEQIKPEWFGCRPGDPPTKESDVHSFAMTAYKVRFPPHPCARLRASYHYQVLTGTEPYDKENNSEVTTLIINGTRPFRQTLKDPNPPFPDKIWEMMVSCWRAQQLSRWDIGRVCDEFSRMEDVTMGSKNGK